MEFLLLLAVAFSASLYIGWPHAENEEPENGKLVILRDRRAMLLAELREFDTDLANGRITEDDRRAGRRTIGPELRDVTELLRSLGEHSAPISRARTKHSN
jgi:hypothetical protein